MPRNVGFCLTVAVAKVHVPRKNVGEIYCSTHKFFLYNLNTKMQ